MSWSTVVSKKKRTTGKRRDAGTNTGPRGTAPSIPVDIDEGPHALMRHACRTLLKTGTYIDTKFYVYSRRTVSGSVFAPQAVYANEYVLRAKLPSYFDPLLGGVYGKNIANGPLDAPFPKDFESTATDYDYEDDSDFGDEEPDQPQDEASPSAQSSSTPDSPNESSDQPETSTPSSLFGTNCKTVLIKTCAYDTWMAFIYYLYTGEINFSPLRSQKSTSSPNSVPDEKLASKDACAVPCSPKSMYRLADILGYNELKKKAEQDIRSKLSTDNILAELFTSFTCTPGYTEIRDMEIEYAVKHARSTLGTGLSSHLEKLSAEEFHRTAAVVSSLVTKLVGSPSDFQVLSTAYCAHCDTVNPELQCYDCKTKLELF